MVGKKVFANALAAALLLAGCRSGPHIVVGSKNFAEQLLLGEIAAQQIERRMHVTVERRFQIGGTLLAHEALVTGDIDLYPEYTGTALTAILKRLANDDPRDVLEEVRSGYKRWGLRWMDPLGFNNTFAMVTLRSFADAHHLRTLSDAAGYPPGWVLGAGYEFVERPDGLAGLEKTYGLRLAEPVHSMDLGLLYAALEEKKVNLAAGNATDGQLAGNEYFVLEDNRHYFPPYQAAYVVRDATLQKFPQLAGVLGELSGKIDDQTMRQLNYQVQVLHHSGTEVVKEWLSRLQR